MLIILSSCKEGMSFFRVVNKRADTFGAVWIGESSVCTVVTICSAITFIANTFHVFDWSYTGRFWSAMRIANSLAHMIMIQFTYGMRLLASFLLLWNRLEPLITLFAILSRLRSSAYALSVLAKFWFGVRIAKECGILTRIRPEAVTCFLLHWSDCLLSFCKLSGALKRIASTRCWYFIFGWEEVELKSETFSLILLANLSRVNYTFLIVLCLQRANF
jgi:hypothetical protein